MQEQEPGSPLNDPTGVEGDLVAIDTQIVDSSVQHITDGKEVICSIYFLCNKYELTFLLMFADVNVESLEPIQPDITGASSAVPPL